MSGTERLRQAELESGLFPVARGRGRGQPSNSVIVVGVMGTGNQGTLVPGLKAIDTHRRSQETVGTSSRNITINSVSAFVPHTAEGRQEDGVIPSRMTMDARREVTRKEMTKPC